MQINEGVIVKTTNGIAIGGLTLPAWDSTLASVSATAAQLLPIISLVWRVIQIFVFIRKQRRK